VIWRLALIEVKNLTKYYGQHIGVKNLDFTVKRGEILGFLGPNGAGKTTTMNIITGYISATQGSVSVDGHDILEEPEEVKKRLGYLPEQPPLYLDMTVTEYLDFASNIKKVDKKAKKKDMEKIMDVVGIEDVTRRLIKNLSKGYRQRVGLAQALIGNPPVLILDEPTIGLDPKQIIEIRNLIKELGREHTIILSSHILPEVTAVCERVIIIHRGRIVASDTIENLSRNLRGSHRLSVRIAGPQKETLDLIKALPEVANVDTLGSREPDTFDFYVEAKSDVDVRKPVFQAMSKAQYPILVMRSVDLTLEDIFIQLTTDERIEREEVS
jgi:ABC-2 type transport system ATP-binding protein